MLIKTEKLLIKVISLILNKAYFVKFILIFSEILLIKAGKCFLIYSLTTKKPQVQSACLRTH